MSSRLAALNGSDQAEFVATLGPLFEHSPWVAADAYARRPFRDRAHLLSELGAALDRAPRERQLALIRAHPDLAGRLAQQNQLTVASQQEQAGAGLNLLSPAELGQFQERNEAYRVRFGFPFVICARLNRKAEILAAMEARLSHSPEKEFATALAEIKKIAELRLNDLWPA